MKYLIKSVVKSHRGLVREINQDNYYFDGHILDEDNRELKKMLKSDFTNVDNKYFGVFDGMGGEAHGEIAAFLAAQEMKDNFDDFEQYVISANRKIVSEKKFKMGSTLAAVWFKEKNIEICNLGDSKIFLNSNKKLRQISVDHTDEKIASAFNKEGKAALTQHLGIKEDDISLKPFIDELRYAECNQILICSDGLTDVLSVEEINEVLNSKTSLEEKLLSLEKKILDGGAQDNFTIMIFEIKEASKLGKVFKLLGVLLVLSLAGLLFLNYKSNQVIDECNVLYVGDSCKFKYNSKYQAEVDNEEIVEVTNNEIKALKNGSTIVRIKNHDKIIYEKKIVVFSR